MGNPWTSTLPSRSEEKEVILCAVGYTGSGKSSFLNWILQTPNVFQAQISPIGVTSRSMTCLIPGTNFRLVDSVGMGDSVLTRDYCWKDMLMALQSMDLHGGVRGFAFVISGRERISTAVKAGWTQFLAEFGPSVLVNTFLVISHADCIPNQSQWEVDFKTLWPELDTIIGTRRFFVNSEVIGVGATPSSFLTRRMILQLVSSLPGSYRSTTFQEIESKRLASLAKIEQDKKAHDAEIARLQAELEKMRALTTPYLNFVHHPTSFVGGGWQAYQNKVDEICHGTHCLESHVKGRVGSSPTTQDYYNVLVNERERSVVKGYLHLSPVDFLNALRDWRKPSQWNYIQDAWDSDRPSDRRM